MKFALSLLCTLFLISASAQLSVPAGTLEKIEVACASGEEWIYNKEVCNLLVEGYISDAVGVEEAWIEKSASGIYLLRADVLYNQGWGSAAILLFLEGDKLYINANSCITESVPSEEKPCVYKAEFVNLDPCQQSTCKCVGAGEAFSRSTQGETFNLERAALQMRDYVPTCYSKPVVVKKKSFKKSKTNRTPRKKRKSKKH